MTKKSQKKSGRKRNGSVKRDLPANRLNLLTAAFSKDAAVLATLFCLVLIAYSPSIQGTFLWDDSGHVTSPSLQSLHGLWRIWSEPGAAQQYYPLLHSAFWIEHQLWGDSVVGYHLANILLHSVSAFLIVLIVRRLSLPGAWLAGLIFALHPVCVESVAWISEQKSTLSAVFYLAAGLVYLRFDESRQRSLYFWATGLFILALLSKTVTATLPAALILTLWWRHGRMEWRRDALPLSPWLVIGVSAGLFTAWVEKTYIGAQGSDFSLTFLQRCLLAGRVIWFYLSKLAWPSNLTFIYPRFAIDAAAWPQYLYPAGVLALSVYLWVQIPRHRGLLAGWLFFTGTLFPAMGFLNVYPFRYSYVADHFQYIACLGIIVPFASGLARVIEKPQAPKAFSALSLSSGRKRLISAAVCGSLLTVFFILTWRQSAVYADAETLWRTTIARNPGSWLAHNNLGDFLYLHGRMDEALPYIRTALTLKPDNAEANGNYANILQFQGRFDEAIAYYKKALELRPNVASFHGSLATTLVDAGKIEEAVAQYEAALKIDPSNGFWANNLAWILATCPEDSVRKGARAVELALHAVQILGDKDPNAEGTLAAAYAETGRFEEAIEAERNAISLAQSSGDAELAMWHEQLLETYRARQPYRESTLQPK